MSRVKQHVQSEETEHVLNTSEGSIKDILYDLYRRKIRVNTAYNKIMVLDFHQPQYNKSSDVATPQTLQSHGYICRWCMRRNDIVAGTADSPPPKSGTLS